MTNRQAESYTDAIVEWIGKHSEAFRSESTHEMKHMDCGSAA